MKTVTNQFVATQRRPATRVLRTVEYKRRYWDETTSAYLWEAAWSILPTKDLVSVSPVNWQLDSDLFNEFKVSNVTLVLNNATGKFIFDNPSGFFGADSGSPYNPYEPYWTKFRVKVGYLFTDGTSEQVILFTGVATEFMYDSDNKTAQLTVQGLEALLANTKAESIATVVTEENAGTGNGILVDFTTANPGVGLVSEVSVAGIRVVEGADYTVSQLNDSTLGAKITFDSPPDVGDVVRITYSYWPQNYAFHELVGLLLDAAGIPSASQNIDPVVFGNSVINTQQYTVKADFDAGTLTNISTTRVSPPLQGENWTNSFKIDWTSANFKEATTHSQALTGWTNGSWTSDGTSLIGGVSSGAIYRDINRLPGVIEFKFKYTVASGIFRFGTVVSANLASPDAYLFEVTVGTNFSINGFDTGVAADTNFHTVQLITYGLLDGATAGTTIFKLTFDGTDIYAGDLFARNYGNYLVFKTGAGVTAVHVKEIYIPPASVEAIWTTPTIDAGVTPTAWRDTVFDGQIELLNGTQEQSTIFETRTSTDGVTWASWTAVSSQLIPQSTLNRYIQFRVRIPIDFTVIKYDVRVDEIQVSWVSSSVIVTLPAFTGSSVYDALQKIGQFTNYEFGFSPDETFFFRPKTPGTSVMSLTQSDYNARISGMTSGYEKVYGTIRASYGAIVKEVTDTGDFPQSAKARVLDSRYELSADSAIQIAASADIATGMATQLFSYLSKRRRRFKLLTILVPQLDLGDVVAVTLINNTPSRLWYLSESLEELGDDSIFMWGEKDQLAFGMDAKIIGARYDVERHNCEFDLEEVVT